MSSTTSAIKASRRKGGGDGVLVKRQFQNFAEQGQAHSQRGVEFIYHCRYARLILGLGFGEEAKELGEDLSPGSVANRG